MTTHTNPFSERPHTRLGWWAVWLMAAFVGMFLINSFIFMPSSSDALWRHIVLPFYGIAMLLCGLVSGVLSLIAILRQHERSWLVWLPLLPLLWVAFMLVGEFLFPH
jgi:hypothetical protein